MDAGREQEGLIMPELFGIPQYSIKRSLMELDPSTGEPYMARWLVEHREEAIALELHENTLICHVERVISSLEAIENV